MDQTRRAARPFLWIAAVLWLLPALFVIGGYLVLPHDNPNGQCEGLGFGCTISPADGVLWIGMIAAGPLLIAGLVAMLLVVGFRAVRSRSARSDRPAPRD